MQAQAISLENRRCKQEAESAAAIADPLEELFRELCLHDPVWYDHLPYLPFPDHWPVFSPKDKIGDWLEMYVKVMELNYWHATECRSARYHEDTRDWTVTVVRNGETVVLRPRQLVLATGMSGMPNVPQIPGADTFRGTQYHSSQFRGMDDYRGKKCVVLGSNNSAHDICAALWEQEADVTMIQRSSTHVARSATLMELGLGRQGGHHDGRRRLAVRLDPVSNHAQLRYSALSRNRQERCRSL